MKKMCIVAAVPQSIQLFMSDIAQNASKDFNVTIASHPSGNYLSEILGLNYHPILIERKPSLIKDLISLFSLIAFFKREKFYIVHSITPKTGFLSMLAAFITRVPIRIHTFTGQVWLNKRGYKRYLLKLFDKLMAICCTHILVDSPSQRDFLLTEGILKKDKSTVLGKGSICGVDLNRYKFDADARNRLREEAGLPSDAVIIIFMARLTRQKGILELAEAFNSLAETHNNLYLWVIGTEETVTFQEVLLKAPSHTDHIIRTEFTNTPEAYLSASDILCLPSHMEGFGQVIVNASACQLPVVGTRIIGVRDAVEEGVTGLLYTAGNVQELVNTLALVIADFQLRTRLGLAGRKRVIAQFDQSEITNLTLKYYQKIIKEYETFN